MIKNPRHIAFLFIIGLALCGSWWGDGNPRGRSPAAAAQSQPELTPTPSPLPGSPVILSVQPNTTSNTAVTELVITGSNFLDGAVVIIENYGALSTTFVSANVLRATLPAGAPAGQYNLSVINPDATSTTMLSALRITAPAGPTGTPEATATPQATTFVRPLLIVESYGASSPEITPGQNLDFEMTFANAGQSQANNIIATFVSGSFIPRDTGGVRAIGSLASGQTFRFWQPLTASRDLSGQLIGSLEVKVSYTDANGTLYNETFALTFPIVRPPSGPAATSTPTPTPTPTATPTATATVAPRLRPQLIVTGYTIDVEQLRPGTTFTLQLTVQNQGNADARRVTMILGGGDAGGGLEGGTPQPGGLAGAGGEFSKFAPVGTSNVQFIGDVLLGNTVTASQSLIVNASADPGAYPVKVSFVYNDTLNGNYVDDQVITLLVLRPPVVEMTFYAPAPTLFVGQPGSLPLQLVNGGKNSAVFGTFSVTADGAFLENNSIFVGALEPGGVFPLDALVYPDLPGPLTLLLSVNYTDDFNQPQVVTQTVTLEVMEAFIEEPLPDDGTGGEPVLPTEPEPEGWQDKVWRFLLGLLGLSSGRPEPAATDSFAPVSGEEEGVPIDSGPVNRGGVFIEP